MREYFDIYGTPIKFSSIKEFRIVQKEYIYRPVYVEKEFIEQKLMKKSTYTRYIYDQMIPYAAIIDEADRRSIFKGIKTETAKGSIGKEILEDIRETVGDKFNIKAIKAKRYKCVNTSGRESYEYLDDIPALIMTIDGRMIDITKDHPLYLSLGETITPAINVVHALVIRADQVYTFWGNGIQIENIHEEYKRLMYEMEQYKQEKKIGNKLFSKPEYIEEKKTRELPNFTKMHYLLLNEMKKG